MVDGDGDGDGDGDAVTVMVTFFGVMSAGSPADVTACVHTQTRGLQALIPKKQRNQTLPFPNAPVLHQGISVIRGGLDAR
jgi:hypothetical protein